MSVQARLLNRWLRWTERPHLQRATDPKKLRRRFETQARLFFQGPRGAVYDTAPMGGCSCVRVTPTTVGTEARTCILYFHGGGYVFGSPATHRKMLAQLGARLSGACAILPDYRKAPEHPFPAAVEDALAVYEQLLADGFEASSIFIGGDSAGGGLALSLLGQITAKKLAQPRGVFVFSPLTDLTCSGASLRDNAARDVVLPAERARQMSETYMGGSDCTDPRASPLRAEFTGAAPVAIWVGDTEILRDDSRRMAERLRAQGVDVTLIEEHDLPHVWPLFHNILPEARRTLDQVADWINTQAGTCTPTR